MRLQSSLVLLSLLQTTTAGKHKQAKTLKHRAKKLEHQKEIDTSLIQTKALTWPWYPAPNNDVTRVFGPKHKGRLCNTLTSSVVLFDVDNSGGLDWAEFQVFNTAVFDVVEDHVKVTPAANATNRKLHTDGEPDDLSKVYHDFTCECHYIFGDPINCCHEEEEADGPPKPNDHKIQVSLQGLILNSEGRTEEEKLYRRHFCDGIMYLLESEGVDLETAHDAIVAGMNADIVDFDIVDVETTVAATVTTTPIAVGDEESASDAGEEADEVSNDKVDGEGTITKATVAATQSATTTPIALFETSKQVDASTSSIMTPSTSEDDTTNNNSSVATSATIGILFAILAAVLATVMAIMHRKREEKRRLAEFAGEELVEDEDLEANSVHNDVVAMEMGENGEKVYEESTTPEIAETEIADSEDKNDDDNSDVTSVVSVEQNECAQISFGEDEEGDMEAKVTVGSTLAAMGVASTVTSRLSAQPAQESTDV